MNSFAASCGVSNKMNSSQVVASNVFIGASPVSPEIQGCGNDGLQEETDNVSPAKGMRE